MTTYTWRILGVSFMAVLALVTVVAFGCSSDGSDDTPYYDGDAPDGDEDGDAPDGDADGDSPDGDTLPDGDDVDGDEDGDEEDGDEEDGDIVVPTSGSISGVLHTGQALAASDATIALFNVNPFEQWGVAPVKTLDIAGDDTLTEKTFTLEEVPTGRYYMWAYLNVGNDQNTANDVFNVYPRVITLVAQEPDLRHVTGANIYIDVLNAELGSISGQLHSSPAYSERRVMMVASRVIDNEERTEIEYWPSSVVFLEGGANATRPYLFSNLFDGSYYTFAYVSTGETTPPLVYGTPYAPLQIEVATPAKKDYTDAKFYLGLADPSFASISGNIILPRPIEGELGVYVFSSKAEDDSAPEVEPMAFVLVKNDGLTTTIPYVVGNLGSETDIWVAGGLQLSEEKIAFGFHPEALTVDVEDPTRKDLAGKNINVPITEITGTVTVTSDSDPTWIRVVLADISVNWTSFPPTLSINDLGGGVDVELAAPARGTQSASYSMFPVKGGNWSLLVVLDTDLVEGISDGDQWCFQGTVSPPQIAPKKAVDGTALLIDTGWDITVNTASGQGWICTAAPAN